METEPSELKTGMEIPNGGEAATDSTEAGSSEHKMVDLRTVSMPVYKVPKTEFPTISVTLGLVIGWGPCGSGCVKRQEGETDEQLVDRLLADLRPELLHELQENKR